MTYPQTLATIKEVARLHAWSLTTSIDWRSKIPAIEGYRSEVIKDGLMNMETKYGKTKEKYPEYFGSIDVEKLAEITSFDSFMSIYNEYLDFMDDVLLHGDVHGMNAMFEKNKNGTASDRLVALIDFQLVMK